MYNLLWIKRTLHWWAKTLRWLRDNGLNDKRRYKNIWIILEQSCCWAQTVMGMVGTTTVGVVVQGSRWATAITQMRTTNWLWPSFFFFFAVTRQNALPRKGHYFCWPFEKAHGPQNMTLSRTVALLQPRCAMMSTQSAGATCWYKSCHSNSLQLSEKKKKFWHKVLLQDRVSSAQKRGTNTTTGLLLLLLFVGTELWRLYSSTGGCFNERGRQTSVVYILFLLIIKEMTGGSRVDTRGPATAPSQGF